MRRTCSTLGFFSVLWTEMRKGRDVLAYELDNTITKTQSKTQHLVKVMQGTDGTPEELEKERQHKEAYQSIRAKQAAKAAEEYNKKLAAMPSWKEKLQFHLKEAAEAAKTATSKKSGVVAIIQHCAAAHAAEVAVEQGIDVHNVEVVLEKKEMPAGIAAESKVVGYIDAPNATEEEVMVFAQRLTKACPAAKAYASEIEWRKRPLETPSTTTTTTATGDAPSASQDSPFLDDAEEKARLSVNNGQGQEQQQGESGAAAAAAESSSSPSGGATTTTTTTTTAGMPGSRPRFTAKEKPKPSSFRLD